MAHLRVDQLGSEVVAQYAPSGDHARVDQLGSEIIGQYNSSHLRVDQLGSEVIGTWTGGGYIRIDQLGSEVVGVFKNVPPPTSGYLRVNQLGSEVVGRLLVLSCKPAGDTTGYEYYVGPGFVAGTVPKRQPSSYEPQWGPVQILAALGSLEGVETTIQTGIASNVPLGNGSTSIQVTFPQSFNQACYFVWCVYQPVSGDTTNIFVYGNPYASETAPTTEGFMLTGVVVSGTAFDTTGTFSFVAVGL